jgi:hypothetical protein
MGWLTNHIVFVLVTVGMAFSSGYANIKKCNRSPIGIKLVVSIPASKEDKDTSTTSSTKTCQTADWTSASEVLAFRPVLSFPKTVQQLLPRNFSKRLQAHVNELYKPPRC